LKKSAAKTSLPAGRQGGVWCFKLVLKKEEKMDTEKCRYGKKHSLINLNSSKNYTTGKGESNDWCEICGIVIKTESVLRNWEWVVKNVTVKIPQIAKEVLAAEKTEAEQAQLGYDGIFYIDDQYLGQ
jgi:hypothetical protein